jgi:hypothetical protein
MRRSPLSRRRGFTQIEFAVLLGISSLLGVQIIPAINDAREAARRTQCKDNLHNLGLANHNYAEVYGERMPNGWVQYSYSASEGLGHGWQMRLLPFLDQAPMYNRIYGEHEDYSTDQPSPLFLTTVPPLRCPSDDSADLNAPRGGWATSNYPGNFGSKPAPRWNLSVSEGFWPGEADTPIQTDGIYMCNHCVRLSDITDGSSNTFMVGERSSFGNAAIWMGVRGNRFESDVVAPCSWDSPINQSEHGFSSRHPGGSHFLTCDGAVYFVSDDIDQANYELLASRNDGQQVDPF